MTVALNNVWVLIVPKLESKPWLSPQHFSLMLCICSLNIPIEIDYAHLKYNMSKYELFPYNLNIPLSLQKESRSKTQKVTRFTSPVSQSYQSRKKQRKVTLCFLPHPSLLLI